MALKQWSLSHPRALAEYRYDPVTGAVVGPRGHPVGHVKRKTGPDSRCKVVVDRGDEGCLPIARLIWFLVTGEWPAVIVDHVNGDPEDQRWSNLRLATVRENNRNSAQRLGVSGYRNVVRGGRGNGWRVEFEHKLPHGSRDARFRSGQFDTLAEAMRLADSMRAELHGAFASVRIR